MENNNIIIMYNTDEFVELKQLPSKQLDKECKKLLDFAKQQKDSILPKNSFVGNKLIYHFQILSMMKTRRDKKLSFYERINNEQEYIKLHNNTIKRNRTGDMRERLLQCHNINKGSIVAFKSSQAIHCYNKFDTKAILDPTAGWGGRLLGAWSMGIDYTGIDTNINLKDGYDKMIKMLQDYDKKIGRISPKMTMIWEDTLTVDYEKIDYDMVLTSPPYFNLEVYEHMTPFDDNNEYLKFLNDIYDKCVNSSKTQTICINVSPKIFKQWNSKYDINEPSSEVYLKQQYGNNSKDDKIYVWNTD